MERLKKVLFISYHFEPYIGVGSQRVSYWAKNISNIDSNIICDVITATEPKNIKNDNIRKIFYVKNTKKGLLKYLIKDAGVTWYRDLKKFFDKNKKDLIYDAIVISGSPFMHFKIAKYLKKKFNFKLILDFRDPFANNPRFGDQKIKRWIKSQYEKFFIQEADMVITVNRFCKDLLVYNPKFEAKIHIIDNGYDEKKLDLILKKDRLIKDGSIKFAYAGSFYEDCNPGNFLDVVTSPNFFKTFSFHHIGKTSEYLANYRGYLNIHEYGIKKYEDTLEIINSCDIGVIFTGGKEFESTTKIFDYIGLEKAILIVTEGALFSGNLYEITKNYPKVFWCKNKEEDILNTLKIISNSDLRVSFSKRDTFSRFYGLKQLVDIINSLDR